MSHEVSAVTVSNSWPVRNSRLAVGSGGLSGRVVFPDTLRMVADIKAIIGDSMAINACGGIFSGLDAFKVLQAGATTVQLLTSLIYRGPGVARSINEQLLATMVMMGSLRPSRLCRIRACTCAARTNCW